MRPKPDGYKCWPSETLPFLTRPFTAGSSGMCPNFERRWSRYAKPAHPSWRVDETAISVRGGIRYLYRAVDKFGKTVDSLLCADRSVSAARTFFFKALKTHYPRRPQKLNLDGYAASHEVEFGNLPRDQPRVR